MEGDCLLRNPGNGQTNVGGGSLGENRSRSEATTRRHGVVRYHDISSGEVIRGEEGKETTGEERGMTGEGRRGGWALSTN